MKYFIFQGNDHDCGFAALKMLLANISQDKSYLYIPKLNKKESYTLEDIEKIAKSYGVILASYKCDEDYYSKLSKNSLTLIDSNHVVYISEVSKTKIIIFDPSLGKVTLKKKDFLARWKQVVLEVESSENIKKIDKIRREILPLKTRIISSLISLVSTVVLIVVLYLLNNEKNAIFSLIFVVMFAVFVMIENFINYRQIYLFDKTFINPYFKQKRNQNKLSYMEFINFKRTFFTGNRYLLSSVLIAFLVTFLLCLNDFRNVFVLIVLILLKVLEIIVFGKGENKAKRQIADYEDKTFKLTDQCEDYAMKANTVANQLVFQNSLKSMFYLVVSFVFALVMMIITKNSGCNYVIFHFVLFYTGSTAFTSIIENLSNKEENEKMKARFFDSCNF